jgi:type II secretory pathway component PulF
VALYQCRVSDSRGKVQMLVRSGVSEERVIRDLSTEGLYPLSVVAVADGEPSGRGGSKRISQAALAEFTEVVSILLASHLSVKEAVRVAAESLERGAAKELALLVATELEKGRNLSDVLAQYEPSVPVLYVGLCRIGERIGSLDRVMGHLSRYLNQRKELRDKIASALLYPALVLVLALGGMAVISIFVIPLLEESFASLTGGAAEMLAVASGRIARITVSFWVAAGVLAAVAAGVALTRRLSAAGRLAIDRLALRLPLVGSMGSRTASANFLFAMEALTASGVAVEDALREAARSLSNKAYAAALTRAQEKVQSGVLLSSALRAEQIVPGRIRSWVEIGEHTGDLGSVFGHMRAYYQKELEKTTTRLTGLIEPLLIIGVGIALLVVILRVIVPVFTAVRTIA